MLLEGLNLNRNQAEEFKDNLDSFQTLGLKLNAIINKISAELKKTPAYKFFFCTSKFIV